MAEWLGHWDGCSCQWSTWCDCDPSNPIDLAGTEVGETTTEQEVPDGA